MQKLLSIVIPVYKVEPYINKCLDSLLIYKQNEKGEQVLDDDLMSLMDILIINDGTPDKSAELSCEYVKKYPQYFRQIDKENGGHGSVWNMGVKEARGKYIKFLDSDDWFENLDKFLSALQRTDSDLVLTSTKCHCENGVVWQSVVLDMDYYHSYDTDTFDWLGNRTHNYLLHHMCAYKTEVFRQYLPGLFLEKQPYDDVVLWPAAMIGGHSIEAFDFVLYNYLMDRPGQSISEEVQRKHRWAKIKTDKHALQFYVNHPVPRTSSKHTFIAKKMPHMLGGWCCSSVALPYTEGKAVAKDWDMFIRALHTDYTSKWVTLYRWLPYPLFRLAYKVLQFGYRIRHRKQDGPDRYIPVKE